MAILVVEDEEGVRRYSTDALRDLGYRVLEADSGEAALKIIDAEPDIAILFTDVVMPDMNGRQLAEAALERRPALKVLFTTGYTRNAIVHNGMLDPGCEPAVEAVHAGGPGEEGGGADEWQRDIAALRQISTARAPAAISL